MAGARYLRYIIFACLCLIVVLFISSASDTQHIQNAQNVIQDRWKGISQSPIDMNKYKAIFGAKPQTHAPPPPPPPDGHEEPDEPYKSPWAYEKTSPKEDDTHYNPSTGTTNHEHQGSDFETGRTGSHQTSHFTGHKQNNYKRMNATFVTLARNSDIWDIADSIKQVEDRFNHQYNYDWVFLNDEEFDDDFKKLTSNLVSGKTKYGLIPEEHWSFPEWIDQDKAAEVRKDMRERKIIYGDSVSYRHMCRFESGFFFRQPLLMEYEWYWRVEPSIKLYCDIPYDTFKFMADHNKTYSFVLSLFEYEETIPTIWQSVQKFMKNHPEHISDGNAMSFLSDNHGDTYNRCHFWSNFEIGNLNWLRSKAYIDYFNTLDKDGGFFYERWGDAPVHSIAAALMLPKEQIHFFSDIGYWHIPFHHCPTDDAFREERRCRCDPGENFDWNGYSCLNKFYDVQGWEKPPEYEARQ